ncbi:hypothetical protein RTP6_005194 [Batrachochytrium dendrobatidis]
MKRIFNIRSTGGGPTLFEWQRGSSQYLASVPTLASVVRITDRKGALVDSISLNSDCLEIKWSPQGTCLAILQSKNMPLILWDASGTKNVTMVDTGMKNLETMAWSHDGEMMAIASSKGSLFLLDRKSDKRTPVVGKHNKAITAMAWSPTGELACASADKSFSISNREGDTLFQMGLKGEANFFQWSTMKSLETKSVSHVLSMTINNNSILIFDSLKPTQPLELAFSLKYGAIAAYRWFKDNQILVGFTLGYLVSVSTSSHQLGKELFQSKSYKDSLGDIAVSNILNIAATCGDNVIKIHDLSNLQDVSLLITLENERGSMNRLHFSDDGQFLTVSTKDGSLYTYLSKLPLLGHTWFNRVAYLSSLSDVVVADYSVTPPVYVKCDIGTEPSCISLGPKHLAVGVGSKVKYYTMASPFQRQCDGIKPGMEYNSTTSLLGQTKQPLTFTGEMVEKEYPEKVSDTIVMNQDFAAVLLTNGELHLHPLEASFFGVDDSCTPIGQSLIFPEVKSAQDKLAQRPIITCVALTDDFFIYATSNGLICHYDLNNILLVNEFQHSAEIKAIYPKPGLSTKLIFIDATNKAYIMSPILEAPFEIPGFTAETRGILWETTPFSNRNIFVTWDDTTITTFTYTTATMKGPQCRGLHSSTTHLPYGLKPALFLDGTLVCQTPGGKLESTVLATHESVSPDEFLRLFQTEVEQGRALCLLYLVGRMQCIWKLFPKVSSRQAWAMLAEAALHSIDVPTAKRVYRQMLGDAGMMMNLLRIEAVEELTELQGHIAVIFGDFNLAQQYFLISSNPKEALYLRRDLLEWDQALTLANRMWPEEVPIIAREYAMQLEIDGSPAEALAMYDLANSFNIQFDFEEELQEHKHVCQVGLTRMAFRTGDISRGMSLLESISDSRVLSDCANILESIKQYVEAAVIFERGGMLERAAELWIKLKNWNKVSRLIDKLNNPRIFIQYAQAKEVEGQHLEAANAYERAKDYDNLARVLLENLNDVQGAANLVRKTKSRESAKMMTKAFQSLQDYKSTIEFYILAGMLKEAFEISKSQNLVEHFADMVEEQASNDMLLNIATYFQTRLMYLQAGKFFLHASRYAEALRMFLQCPVLATSDTTTLNEIGFHSNTSNTSSIHLAIETVGYAKNDALTHELIDFLMGETDGIPKDAKYIFKLYMSLNQFKEAARTAIIIAREEQVLGNYRAAHDLLFDNYRQLKSTKAKVPAELDRMLMLLHSYILVKTLVKIDDHAKGARMLMRVSNNISKFPLHIVPILTSTVVECHRAGFKKDAFEYASMLMRPEYRQKIDAKFKRKIEQIVRRPEKNDSEIEPTTPCPFCSSPVAESCLDCSECKSRLPYCIATGFHMVLDSWSVCSKCLFPAITHHFKDLVQKTGQCPMCNERIDPESIFSVDDPKSYLYGKSNDIEDGIDPNALTTKPAARKLNEGSEMASKVTELPVIGRLSIDG